MAGTWVGVGATVSEGPASFSIPLCRLLLDDLVCSSVVSTTASLFRFRLLSLRCAGVVSVVGTTADDDTLLLTLDLRCLEDFEWLVDCSLDTGGSLLLLLDEIGFTSVFTGSAGVLESLLSGTSQIRLGRPLT